MQHAHISACPGFAAPFPCGLFRRRTRPHHAAGSPARPGADSKRSARGRAPRRSPGRPPRVRRLRRGRESTPKDLAGDDRRGRWHRRHHPHPRAAVPYARRAHRAARRRGRYPQTSPAERRSSGVSLRSAARRRNRRHREAAHAHLGSVAHRLRASKRPRCRTRLRRPRLPQRARAGGAAPRAQGHLRRSDLPVPGSPETIRPTPALRHHPHRAARHGPRRSRRSGDRRRQLPRSAARHSLGRKGSARRQGLSHYLGCGRLRAPGLGYGRDRRRAARRSRCRSRRQAHPRRARAGRPLVRRTNAQSLESPAGLKRQLGRASPAPSPPAVSASASARKRSAPSPAPAPAAAPSVFAPPSASSRAPAPWPSAGPWTSSGPSAAPSRTAPSS